MNQAAVGMLPTFVVKASISADYGRYRDSVFDATQNRLYILYANDFAPLISIDPDTAEIIDIGNLPVLLQIDVSADGERLYASTQFPEADGENAILVIDSGTLEIIDSFSLPCEQIGATCPVGGLVVGPDDRLYAINDGRIIQVLDGTSGEILGKIVVAYPNLSNGYIVHGDKLYLADQTVYQGNPPQLLRYDIGMAKPVLELSVPLTFDAPIDSISNDGRYLLLGRGHGLYQYDTETLQQVRKYTGDPVNGFVAWAFSGDSEGLVTATGGAYEKYVLQEHTTASGELVKSGVIMGNSQLWGIIGLPDDELAMASYFEVQLVQTFNHSLVLPLTFSNYCNVGVILDHFEDPTSGWPSQDNGDAFYGYDQGEYRITIRQPGTWLAVSRGDYWHNASWTEINVKRAEGHGYFGLIFGLNADFSDFYTFEVYPDLGRFAIFHYTDANGWELIHTDIGINVGATEMVMSIFRNGNLMEIQASGAYYQMPQVSGRIGIIAGSTTPTELDEWVSYNVWFDNYRFVGPNCDDPRVTMGASQRMSLMAARPSAAIRSRQIAPGD